MAAGLRWLAEHGVNSVLSEGGPRVAASLLRDKVVDRIAFIVVALVASGGQLAIDGLPAPLELSSLRARRLGAALLVEGDV